MVHNVKSVTVEVFGPEPPCARCQATKKVAEKVAQKLSGEGFDVKVERMNIISKDTISKYGVLLSPAVAINGKVKIMGRIPKEEEIEKLVREI
jgi:small redox-active disulfide protein 2